MKHITAGTYFTINQVIYMIIGVVAVSVSREAGHQVLSNLILIGEPIILIFTYLTYRDDKRR